MTPEQKQLSSGLAPVENEVVALTLPTLAEWLAERRDNAIEIAKTKHGAERDGWLEDVAYLIAAEHAARYFRKVKMLPGQRQLSADRARVAKLRIEAQNGTAEWCADLARVCDLADIALNLSGEACRELREAHAAPGDSEQEEKQQ